MSEVNNVTAAKPAVGGAVSVAALGTTLPADAKTALDKAFAKLGYASSDGLRNNNSPETSSTNAWGGDVVLNSQTGKPDTFAIKLLEVLDVNVLKYTYGDDNVSGDLENGIQVDATSDEAVPHVIVIDMIMKGGVLKRIIIPNGVVTAIAEIQYTDNTPVGYDLTIQAYPFTFSDGKIATHREYMIKPVSSSGE